MTLALLGWLLLPAVFVGCFVYSSWEVDRQRERFKRERQTWHPAAREEYDRLHSKEYWRSVVESKRASGHRD